MVIQCGYLVIILVINETNIDFIDNKTKNLWTDKLWKTAVIW